LVPVFADSEAGAARGAARRKADERRQGKSRRQEQRRRHCRLALAHLLPRVEPEPGSGMWDGKLLEAAHRLQGTVEPTHEEPGLSSRDYKPDRDIAPAE